jgi:hypothetical protein
MAAGGSPSARAQDPPYLARVNLVREDLTALRCFFSGHDGDADVTTVSVQPLHDDNSPLGRPFRIDVSSFLKGLRTFGVTSNVQVWPWLVGSRAQVTLLDASGAASDPRVLTVPAFRAGAAPVIWSAGDALVDANTLNVNVMGTDPDGDVAEFQVRLYSAAGALLNEQHFDAGPSCPWSAQVVTLSMAGLAGASSGTLTAVDACGNSSAPASLPMRLYGAGTAPVVTVASASRPRTFQVYVYFAGYDRDADQATATVQILDAALKPLAAVDVDYTLIQTGQPDFLGYVTANVGAQAAWASVSVRDSGGNASARALAAIPAPWIPGDGDRDDRVTVADALMALRVALGAAPADIALVQRLDLAPAPLGDGVLTIEDVRSILRIAAGVDKGPLTG